ncbi:hypothetical protein K474DRAFT_1673596 [Panus rudis PR-1116 ss-1]|nr:hypothetical protein K474DRAFT_1673596 [Panus rudis PR-1116 ss-1]
MHGIKRKAEPLDADSDGVEEVPVAPISNLAKHDERGRCTPLPTNPATETVDMPDFHLPTLAALRLLSRDSENRMQDPSMQEALNNAWDHSIAATAETAQLVPSRSSHMLNVVAEAGSSRNNNPQEGIIPYFMSQLSKITPDVLLESQLRTMVSSGKVKSKKQDQRKRDKNERGLLVLSTYLLEVSEISIRPRRIQTRLYSGLWPQLMCYALLEFGALFELTVSRIKGLEESESPKYQELEDELGGSDGESLETKSII